MRGSRSVKTDVVDRLEAVGVAAGDHLVAQSRLRSPFLTRTWQREGGGRPPPRPPGGGGGRGGGGGGGRAPVRPRPPGGAVFLPPGGRSPRPARAGRGGGPGRGPPGGGAVGGAPPADVENRLGD